MNTRNLIAAAAISMLAGSNFAAEFTNFAIEPSTQTRAQVVAALEVARASGELDESSAEYASFSAEEIASTRIRSEAMGAVKPTVRRNTGNYVGG